MRKRLLRKRQHAAEKKLRALDAKEKKGKDNGKKKT